MKLPLIDDEFMDDLLADEPIAVPPPQRLPHFLRTAICAVIYPFVLLDEGAQWLAKKIIRPPYVRIGGCKMRGRCCETILIEKPKGRVSRFFAHLSWWWSREVNGFYQKRARLLKIGRQSFYVCGCRYLQKDGSCGRYRLRPTICRAYPRIEYFGSPQILKGCGYSFKERKH